MGFIPNSPDNTDLPRIEIVDPETGSVISTLRIPSGSDICVKNGEIVKPGDVLIHYHTESCHRRDNMGLLSFAEFMEAKDNYSAMKLAPISGTFKVLSRYESPYVEFTPYRGLGTGGRFAPRKQWLLLARIEGKDKRCSEFELLEPLTEILNGEHVDKGTVISFGDFSYPEYLAAMEQWTFRQRFYDGMFEILKETALPSRTIHIEMALLGMLSNYRALKSYDDFVEGDIVHFTDIPENDRNNPEFFEPMITGYEFVRPD